VSNDPEREDAMNQSLVDELKGEQEEANADKKQLDLEKEEFLKEAQLSKAKTDEMVQVAKDTEAKYFKTIDKCRKEIESLKTKVSETTLQNSVLKNQLFAVSYEKVRLESRVESTNSDLSTAQDVAMSKTAEISNLKSSNQSLVTERDGAYTRVNELLSDIHDAKKAASSLKSLEEKVSQLNGERQRNAEKLK